MPSPSTACTHTHHFIDRDLPTDCGKDLRTDGMQATTNWNHVDCPDCLGTQMGHEDSAPRALGPAPYDAPIGQHTPPPMLAIGTRVSKVGGDYRFDGHVVSAFRKLGGQIRYVVEDDRGCLHIYSEKNLQVRP